MTRIISVLAILTISGYAQDVEVGTGYIDPEFCLSSPCVVFQDKWVGMKTARYQWLDADGWPAGSSDAFPGLPQDINNLIDNGPERIIHGGIERTLYTTVEAGGVHRLRVGTVLVDPADGLCRSHASGSRNASGAAVLLYRRGPCGVEPMDWYWMDLADGVEHHAAFISVAAISLPVFKGRQIVYTDAGQIALYDIDSGATVIVTAGPDEKLGAYPMPGGGYAAAVRRAGETVIDSVMMYDESGVEVKAYTAVGGAVQSPEPFEHAGEVGVVFAQTIDADTSAIYVWMMDDILPVRVDDPAIVARKLDPETKSLGSSLKVYYYYSSENGTKLRMVTVQ